MQSRGQKYETVTKNWKSELDFIKKKQMNIRKQNVHTIDFHQKMFMLIKKKTILLLCGSFFNFFVVAIHTIICWVLFLRKLFVEFLLLNYSCWVKKVNKGYIWKYNKTTGIHLISRLNREDCKKLWDPQNLDLSILFLCTPDKRNGASLFNCSLC